MATKDSSSKNLTTAKKIDKLFSNGSIVPEKKTKSAFHETFNYWIYRYDDAVYKIFKKEISPANFLVESHFMQKLSNHAKILSPDMVYEPWALCADGDKYALMPLEKASNNISHFVIKTEHLPASKMLDKLCGKGQIDVKVLKTIAESLHAFHKRTPFIYDRYSGTFDHLQKLFEDLTFESKKYLHKTISPAVIALTQSPVQRFLTANKRNLYARLKNERIREVHRCLVPSKICIGKKNALFIPMPFTNSKDSYLDVCSDLADLVLSFRIANLNEEAKKITQMYIEISKDKEIEDLLPFYLVFKAYSRGLYESVKILKDDKPKVFEKAAFYFGKGADLATQLDFFVTRQIQERPEEKLKYD